MNHLESATLEPMSPGTDWQVLQLIYSRISGFTLIGINHSDDGREFRWSFGPDARFEEPRFDWSSCDFSRAVCSLAPSLDTDTQLAIAQHHEEICRKRIAALELATLRLDLELALRRVSLLTGERVNR